MILLVLLVCMVSHGAQVAYSQPREPDRSLRPGELFKRVAPSVFVVEALNAEGSVVAFGSGVATAPNQLITNKHVIEDGFLLRVRQVDKVWPATVTHLDSDHDLCRLRVDGLTVRPVPIRMSSTLEVGERVYSIGAPEGLELSLSEGLISGLRDFEGVRLLQTSAAISHGSSGGGLFDGEGRLIGVTTFTVKDGQNLNFALPMEWALALDKHPADSHKTSDFRSSQALTWFLLGVKANEQGKYENALRYFQEAIAANSELAEGWSLLGFSYFKLGRFGDALQAEREAIRLKPDLYEAHVFLGGVYFGQQDFDKAVMAVRGAIRLRPQDPEMWYALGLALNIKIELNSAAASLQQDEAAKAYQEAVRLKPSYVNAWYNLGEIYDKQGNKPGVMGVYRQLKSLDAEKAQRFFRDHVRP